MYDHVLALSDSLKEKDVQSTSQSCQDIMNCLKDLNNELLERPDYVPRDIVNSVALRAFRENWCVVGTHRRNPNMLPFVVAAKAQSI